MSHFCRGNQTRQRWKINTRMTCPASCGRSKRSSRSYTEIVHFMKDHRSQLEGDPILDFAEVCQLLRQSERQVRRFREQGLLVGFTIGARRMYLLSEVQEFIRKMRRRGKLESLNQ